MEAVQIQKILQMKGGEGDYSYAKNSSIQKMAIWKAKSLLQESVIKLYCKYFPDCFKFADLGCASVPSAYVPAWEVVQVLDSTCKRLNRKRPMLQIFLNDLPGSDFNSTFKLLQSFNERLQKEKGDEFGQYCFIAAMPESFYGRLFQPNSLHFVFSSSSLHWLSQTPKGLMSENGIPLNKENICPAKTSPPDVHQAYLDQFQNDFTSFLKFRSEELKPEGRIVLTLRGNDKYYPYLWELLGMVIHDMVSEELIEESKLGSFNVPFYTPCVEEVKEVIEIEGSFNIHKLETYHLSWLVGFDNKGLELDKYARGKHVANILRVVEDSLLANHFGKEIMDDNVSQTFNQDN